MTRFIESDIHGDDWTARLTREHERHSGIPAKPHGYDRDREGRLAIAAIRGGREITRRIAKAVETNDRNGYWVDARRALAGEGLFRRSDGSPVVLRGNGLGPTEDPTGRSFTRYLIGDKRVLAAIAREPRKPDLGKDG